MTGRTTKGTLPIFLEDVVMAYGGDECLFWPFGRSGGGYAQMHDGGHIVLVCRVVCERVHGPSPTPKHQAAHSCGRGTSGCVTKGHLSWKTPVANHADKLIHGTSNRGERHGNSKLTTADVIAIKAARGKLLQREIAEMYSVSHGTVSEIHLGKTWAWLDQPAYQQDREES